MKQTIRILLVMIFMAMAPLSAEEEGVFSITPYGYVKLDAIYETGRSSNGNFYFWAAHPGESDGLFHLTANETRLGLNVMAGRIGSMTLAGKVEIDFNGGGAENKAYNFMRLAYLELKSQNWSIIAGQNWDIVSPLNPLTLNYSPLWGTGNIGYRRPQLSVHHRMMSGSSLFTIQAGIFRTISGDLDGDGLDDGVSSAMPTVQGRLSAKFGLGGSSSIQLGLSGHTGRSKGMVNYNTHSIAMDLLLTLSNSITLLGEYYSGKNMDALLGGIIQGVNSNLKTEIDSYGFYGNLQIALSESLKLSTGYGQDHPNAETLSVGQRRQNQSFWGTLLLNLSKSMIIGLEMAQITTDYVQSETQKTIRIQNAWRLTF